MKTLNMKQLRSLIKEAVTQKEIGHLSQLQSVNKDAYDAYVDMLVEDCQDRIFQNTDGTLIAKVDHPIVGKTTLIWDSDMKMWDNLNSER